jgi:hypothetical protein
MEDTEFKKCLFDFSFFARKYLKVKHPYRGLIDYTIYPYHDRVTESYSNNQCTIYKKFRQGGFTTMTAAWLMWKCMFQLDQRVLWISKTDREACMVGKVVDDMVRNLPEWLAPVMGKNNSHTKEFLDTGSCMQFLSPVACCGKAAQWIVIDEAAFIPKMDEFWACVYPMLYPNGKCIVLSTPNGRGNWFEKTYTDAQEKKNAFKIVETNYLEHPDYQKEEWAKQMKENLGLWGWTQEVLASFD